MEACHVVNQEAQEGDAACKMTKHVEKTPDTKHEHADIDQASAGCDHLTVEQQKQLNFLLK